MKATMRMNRRISCQSRSTIAPVGAIVICTIVRSIRCNWSSIVSSLINHAKIHLKTKTSETNEEVSYRKYQTTFRYVNCA